jgi:hypothetical protein
MFGPSRNGRRGNPSQTEVSRVVYTEFGEAFLDAGGDRVPGLEEEILTFMESACPEERIFRRSELDRFGAAANVDRALDCLARERRVGSPADGIWFPIHYVAGFDYPLPYASLRRLTLSLLQREGVPTCVSRQERDHFRFHETKGREGVWGVPNFEAIGVEEPVHLSLLWNHGGAYTEYQGDLMEHTTDVGFTATAIHDPQKLCRRAEQLDLSPLRVEKDIRVNSVLQGLGLAPWPQNGCLLFAGGTSLVKAWQQSPRFSEDVDFWFLGDAFPPDTSTEKQREVHNHLLQTLQQWVLPNIPGARIVPRLSQFRIGPPVQRAFVEYPSQVSQGHTERLKVEVMFARFTPVWEARPIHSLPVVADRLEVLIPRYPCVAAWVTMLGKLHALTLMHPGRNHQDMRHVHDVGRWTDKRHLPRMVRQALVQGHMGNLLDGLVPALDALSQQDVCRDAYRRYVAKMYPSSHRREAPGLDLAVEFIRTLWQEMGKSDWENPIYEPVPVPLPKEADFKVQSADSGTEGTTDKLQALRDAVEAQPDAQEAKQYSDSWGDVPTGYW